MKKIAVLLLCVSISFLSFSCVQGVNLEMYVSQLRLNAYVYSSSNYTLTVFEEETETPYLLDGYVGKIEKVLIVRLENFKTSPDGASVKLNYNGKELSGDFIYNPVTSKYSTTIAVDGHLQKNELKVTLISGGDETELTLARVTEGSVDVKKVLSAVSKHASSHVQNALDAGGIEVHVRVIPSGNENYYYVCIVDTSGNQKAFLVDGKTAKILAEK